MALSYYRYTWSYVFFSCWIIRSARVSRTESACVHGCYEPCTAVAIYRQRPNKHGVTHVVRDYRVISNLLIITFLASLNRQFCSQQPNTNYIMYNVLRKKAWWQGKCVNIRVYITGVLKVYVRYEISRVQGMIDRL